ncbi:plasmid replication protein [Salmonella enterica subsp. enterica]|nr:plasmid replication protein [Salmonella enterica subsp. enterica serovar Hvittingfoss]
MNALDYFNENLPRKPYFTDELIAGLRIGKVARAKLARYIQQNQPHAQFWLVFDVDRQGAAIDWTDLGAPAPNLVVMNPENAHAHLLYALETAIRTAPDGSVRALKYAASVERALCAKLGADCGYSGLICKNPNSTSWRVTQWQPIPYTLEWLADYVDLEAAGRAQNDADYGLGRNCHLFEKTRKWAYRAIRQGWPEFSQWLAACCQRVELYNVQLPVPLSMPECHAIGRSIAKWTHSRFTASGFAEFVAATHTSEIQAARGRKSKRGVSETSARTLKPWEQLGISRRTYYYRKANGLLNCTK